MPTGFAQSEKGSSLSAGMADLLPTHYEKEPYISASLVTQKTEMVIEHLNPTGWLDIMINNIMYLRDSQRNYIWAA